jgi:hypothetical protein
MPSTTNTNAAAPSRGFGEKMDAFSSNGVSPVNAGAPGSFNQASDEDATTLNVGAREWKPPAAGALTASSVVSGAPQPNSSTSGGSLFSPNGNGKSTTTPAYQGGGGGGAHLSRGNAWASPLQTGPRSVFGSDAAPTAAAADAPADDDAGMDSFQVVSGGETSNTANHSGHASAGGRGNSQPSSSSNAQQQQQHQRKPQPQIEYKSSQHQAVEIQMQIRAKQQEQLQAALAARQQIEAEGGSSNQHHHHNSHHHHLPPLPTVMELPPGPKEGEPILVLGIPFTMDSVPSHVRGNDWRLRIIKDRVDTKAKADAECEGKRLKHDFMYGDQMKIPLTGESHRELARHLRPGSGSQVGLDALQEVVNFFPLDVRPPQHGYPRHMLCLGPNIQQVDTHRAFFAFCGQIPGSVNAAQLLDVIAFLTHSELPPPIAVEKVGDGRCARVYYRTWEEVKKVVGYNHCALIGEYGCWIGTRNAAPAMRTWHECRKREVFPKGVGPLSLEFPKDKASGHGSGAHGTGGHHQHGGHGGGMQHHHHHGGYGGGYGGGGMQQHHGGHHHGGHGGYQTGAHGHSHGHHGHHGGHRAAW